MRWYECENVLKRRCAEVEEADMPLCGRVSLSFLPLLLRFKVSPKAELKISFSSGFFSVVLFDTALQVRPPSSLSSLRFVRAST